jgi:EAL domain-containing protein (putative c-di-GMP-specific phosphodiesterase class I)
LARTLNIRVLAEGVETLAQLEFLQDHGCSEVQGFFLGVPMAAADLLRWLDLMPEAFEALSAVRC